MNGALPIVIAVAAAMLAPLGAGGGQPRDAISGSDIAAAADNAAALEHEGCTVTFLQREGAATDRARGCEDWLASSDTRENRL